MPVYPIHDTFPMIEVANPHFGVENDQSRVICVYRPWTESECSEACKDLGNPLTNVNEFIARHKQLCSSYRLNGQETEATFRKCLTYNWARVRGTYTGRDGNTVLPYGHANLRGQVDGVYERLRNTFKASVDYNKIAQCIQKAGEDVHEFRARLEEVFKEHSGLEESAEKASPYQQQLKHALMNGFHSPIADFIRKQNVSHNTDGSVECMNWARHAQEVIKNKKKKSQSSEAAAFLAGEILFQGQAGRGQNRGRNRRNRGSWGNRGKKDDRCYACGEMGHHARECPDRMPEEYKRPDPRNPYYNK